MHVYAVTKDPPALMVALSQTNLSVSCVTSPLCWAFWSEIQLENINPSERKAAARLKFWGSAMPPMTPSTLPLVKPMCTGGWALNFFLGLQLAINKVWPILCSMESIEGSTMGLVRKPDSFEVKGQQAAGLRSSRVENEGSRHGM